MKYPSSERILNLMVGRTRGIWRRYYSSPGLCTVLKLPHSFKYIYTHKGHHKKPQHGTLPWDRRSYDQLRQSPALDTGTPSPLQFLWNKRLDLIEPNGRIQAIPISHLFPSKTPRKQVEGINIPRTSISSQASRLQTPILSATGAAWRVVAPERARSPGCPADILGVLGHVVDYTSQVRLALRCIRGAKFGDHGFELVLLEPGC